MTLARKTSPEALALAGLWASLLDLTFVCAFLAMAVNAWAPPQDLPWKPFDLDRPVGLATGAQFSRAANDPLACRRALESAGVALRREPDRRRGDCATLGAIRLDGEGLSPAGPVMSCPLALGYAAWMRHVVQPAASAELGAAVIRVEHYGTYACRNLYGRTQGRRSEHAFANALDVASFRTADGGRISVRGDFREDDSQGRFLRRARDGACLWFRAVLGPDYNAAHADHLHLDFGRYRICR